MKLVIAIVQDYDTDPLLRAVAAAGLRATRIASTGGFLRLGNTTVLLGVEDGDVRRCMEVLRRSCRSRVEELPAPMVDEMGMLGAGTCTAVTIGGAVAFVLPVDRFVRIAAQIEPA